MSTQNKNTNTSQAKTPDKKKQIIIGVICAIVCLNVMWTIMQNKFTPKLDGVKSDVAGVEQRITKIETDGIPDVANLKADFAELRKAADDLSGRIQQLLKLEEEQLAYLEAQTAAQKARVEALRKLAAPAE
ncbi:MAG: hypothetical protein IJS39_08080 [Synergistaceae bacterium]|nr:hypothetical protein [Synergistaceae bacterium]